MDSFISNLYHSNMNIGQFTQIQCWGQKSEMLFIQVPSWTAVWKPSPVYILSLILECQSCIITCSTPLGHAEQVLHNVTFWWEWPRSCFVITSAPNRNKALNERQGDWAVSSGLGLEAACSPCPTLHLGSFKAFLIAYLWSRPASSYIKHSSYTHRISPPFSF